VIDKTYRSVFLLYKLILSTLYDIHSETVTLLRIQFLLFKKVDSSFIIVS